VTRRISTVLWIGIAIAVVLAALWTVTLLTSLPLWVAIVVTVVALLAFVGVLVFRRVRAASRAAALERELLRQASHQAEGARPDRRAEIVELQTQMKAALATLKRSKLGGTGGQSALYALPWYVIVGPPAAGKTTALERSGLAFTAPPGSGGAKVRGTAGTRNCDWWFSRDAILLDTAGRFATHDDDQEEWLTFLDTVRRFRPERPLDGLVVAISVEDLVNAPDARVDELAQKLRSRLDELMSRLEMVLPVYVMVTKADLIAGFVEFWADLSKQQRGQAWGATFAVDDDRLAEPARAFESEFDELARVLHARMLERLNKEQLPEVRAKVLQHPIEFQALRAPLARFLDELCRSNPYSESPLLRGFYFSSGTQTGRAIERVLSNMVRGFDLRMSPAVQATPPQPQSYFVTELFQRVVFPDRHLAVRSSHRLKRHARRQIVVAAVAMGVTLLVLTPALVSYANNRDLIDDTSKDVTEALRLEGAGETGKTVDLLQQRVSLLEQAKSDFTIPALWGPRSAPELMVGVQSLYLKRLRTVIEGQVRDQLVGDVRGVGTLVRADAENFHSAYADLKLYLMLTEPKRLQVDWASNELAKVWARASSSSDTAKLAAHARHYLNALAADHTWAWPADATIIAQAQGRLASQPLDDLRYGFIVENAKGVPPIRPEKIFFGPSAEYVTARDNVEVPGLYTALGWQKVRAALASPDARLEIEPWVLGRPEAEGASTGNAERLRELYFQRYSRAWLDFLSGLEVKAPEDVDTAVRELRVLTEAEGPYVRLFRTLSENLSLEVDPPTLIDKAVDQAQAMAAKALKQDAGPGERVVSSVEKQFKPLLRFGFGDSSGGKGDATPSGLSQYLAQLTTLEVALTQMAEAKGEPTSDFGAELSRTAGAVQRLLAGLDSSTRLVIEPLLMNPIRGSRAGVSRAGDAALADKWKAEVWEAWNTTLAARYPFAEVPAEATVAEFSEFFRPQTGILWRFYEATLRDRLERSGNAFVPKAAAEPVAFRPDFMKCLNVAQEITDAVFGTAPMPQVPFSVNIQPAASNIAEVALRIDGQAIVYRNEPERWQQSQWPGKGPQRGGTLQVKGAGFTDEIPRDGEFGLFRLLASGGLKAVQGGGIPILAGSWTLARPGDPVVTIQFKPAKSTHPFTKDFFRRMKCPAEIAPGAAAAR
jgi:type VI secretion system protein ImpL